MLFDLMRVGLLTGCRISEPCQLRTADMRIEGRAFRISHGKRRMPGASYQFTDQLGRSCSSALHARHGWVCSGLTPAGPDGKRSWIVVKRFATFCQKVLGPSKQVDVHSFRRCFATYLQRASTHTTTVNSSVIAELMGHAKPRSALPYTRQDSDRSNSEPPSRH